MLSNKVADLAGVPLTIEIWWEVYNTDYDGHMIKGSETHYKAEGLAKAVADADGSKHLKARSVLVLTKSNAPGVGFVIGDFSELKPADPAEAMKKLRKMVEEKVPASVLTIISKS